jgi:hypothetical protein
MAKFSTTEQQLKDFFLKTGGFNKLSDSNFKFKKAEVNSLVKTINQFKKDGDGEVTPFPRVASALRDFDDLPATFHEVPDKMIGDFLKMVKEIDVEKHFPNHELTFRFNIGHDNSPVGKLTYGVVITPICSPLIEPGQIRNHLFDKEDQLFKKHSEFFSIVVSGNQKADITKDPKLCRSIIDNKDPHSQTELAYFSLEQFEKFRDGIKEKQRREKMAITFGRTPSKSITLFLSFLDKNDNLLESEVTVGGVSVSGVFFDQTDLIPPPSPVTDRSF